MEILFKHIVNQHKVNWNINKLEQCDKTFCAKAEKAEAADILKEKLTMEL